MPARSGVVLYARIPPTLLRDLKARAKAEHRSVANLVVHVLTQHLAENR